MNSWRVYTGTGKSTGEHPKLPMPPPWRRFHGVVPEGFDPTLSNIDEREQRRAKVYRINTEDLDELDAVNAAIYLRRPLLLTGKAGTGKSSLAYSVATELQLGQVLYWPITTRSTLREGLYDYDAIGRLQATNENKNVPIEEFLRLGPLGTALLPSNTPRVLLIDEIDKSDIDLPNDLLNIFEEGRFEIPELWRLRKEHKTQDIRLWKSDTTIPITKGEVICQQFPLIFMTSNGERDFPPAFLRRCLQLTIKEPNKARLGDILDAHFAELEGEEKTRFKALRDELIEKFLERRGKAVLATDQLMNAVQIVVQTNCLPEERDKVLTTVLQSLGRVEDE